MPKSFSGSSRRIRKATGNLMHNDASLPHSDGPPKRVPKRKPKPARPARPIKVCPCCGEEFIAYRDNQVYKSGHYRNRYEMHKCPDCGVMHLKGIGVK